MGVRVRSVSKIGKGRYVTSSWKLSDYIWAKIFYYIFIFPFYAFIKYLIYYPIRWCVLKIKSLIVSKNQ